MTQLPDVVDMKGHSIALASRLASGGEGTVFTLANDPSLVAKVFHRVPSVQTAEKLDAMVSLANPRLLSLAAWPIGLLFQTRTRQLAGFLMPREMNSEPIQHLYNPHKRLECYPRAGWNFQVRVAMNLAAAFEEVHKSGCIVGDVNQSNALVSMKALVRLIDCDSFQVKGKGRPFLCEVGVPLYTPPELQRKSFRGLVRTENHDQFGLAVLIYQLLFVGRHPYAGVYRGPGDPSPEQLIAEYRFAQGPTANSLGMSPPPHTPTFADIPPNIAILFRRAFERGGEAGTRPSPAEWLGALKQLELSIVECPMDAGHKYWFGRGSCVWCKLAEHGGPEYYFGVVAGVANFEVNEAKLKEVRRRLSASEKIDFHYDRRQFNSSGVPVPDPIPPGIEEHHSTAIILSLVTGFCFLGIILFQGPIRAASLLGALVFGIWLAIHFSLSPWYREYRSRKRVCHQAHKAVKDLEDKWKGRIGKYRADHTALIRLIMPIISNCQQLKLDYKVELQQLTQNAESLARIRHLRLHQIADACIPKIGAGRKQTLAEHKIFTAADVEDSVIRRINGFGDMLTSNILDWKAEVERRFRFDPATAVSSGERRPVTMKYKVLQQKYMVEMDRELAKLEKLAPACQASLQNLIPNIQSALVIFLQAEADLNHMKIKKQ